MHNHVHQLKYIISKYGCFIFTPTVLMEICSTKKDIILFNNFNKDFNFLIFINNHWII